MIEEDKSSELEVESITSDSDITRLNLVIRKDNEYIQGMHHSLSVIQHRIILDAVWKSMLCEQGEMTYDYPVDDGFPYVKLDLKFISGLDSLHELSGAAKRSIRTQLGDLTRTSFNLKYRNKKNGKDFSADYPIATGVVGEIGRGKKADYNGGDIYIRLNEVLINRFKPNFDKGYFTQYRLQNVYNLSRGHSWALYDLLRQELNKRRVAYAELVYELEYLVENLSKGKYRKKNGNIDFNAFKTRVLLPAVDDINAADKCDLIIRGLNFIKSGRTVSQVKWSIEDKTSAIANKDATVAGVEALEVHHNKKDKSAAGLPEAIFNQLSLLFQDGNYGRKSLTNNIKSLLLQHTDPEWIVAVLMRMVEKRDEIKAKAAYFKKSFAAEKAIREGKGLQGQMSFSPQESTKVTEKNTPQNYSSTQGTMERLQEQEERERFASMYNEKLNQLKMNYIFEYMVEKVADYVDYLQTDSPVFERKFFSEWEAKKPSEQAKRFFGTWLIRNFGTAEDKEFLAEGLDGFIQRQVVLA
ncbi:replication initiation protein [Persicobacter psychrovividus]|uniref:Initiator Rep protein WH1 domain-containing protein n=1 Tax=Persicobacter psychrovividus TaxID=387638 RepID=A0ABM7VLT9_9BACT|nr:hypothetical protein PEPS_42420 [Persicobacter psychrovividus]